MAPVEYLRPQDPPDNHPRNPLLHHFESPEARQRLKDKGERALGFAMDSLDTVANVMVAIGKVTRVPYLAESAGLVVTIIDIVAKMKSNKEKFKSLARRTANIVSIIYQEFEKKGRRMSMELEMNMGNVHEELILIARFCQKKLETKAVFRAVQRKPDSDAIDEYEKRLDHTLKEFNFKTQIGNTVLLEEMHRWMAASQPATDAEKDNMLKASLNSLEDRKDALDKRQRELDEEEERRRALLDEEELDRRARLEEEENRRRARIEEQDRIADEKRAREDAEWKARKEAAELIDAAKKEKDRLENEAMAAQAKALARREQEKAAASREEQERLTRAEVRKRELEEKKAREAKEQQRVWKEARAALFVVKLRENESESGQTEDQSRATEDADRRRLDELKRRQREEEERRNQRDAMRPPQRVDEHLLTAMSGLQVDDFPARPHSWNPPSQQRYDENTSSPPPRRNPDNNPFRNPEIMRSHSRNDSRVSSDYSRRPAVPAHAQSFDPSYDPAYGYDKYEEPYYPQYNNPPMPHVPRMPPMQMNGGYNVNSGNVGSTIITNSYNRRPAGGSRYR